MTAGRPTSQRPPVVAAVGGFEDAAVGAAKRSVLHEALLLLPEGGVDGVGIFGIDAHVVAAGVFVLEQAPYRRWRRRRWSGRCRARDWGRRDVRGRRQRDGSGFRGSTSMLAIICESRSPRCVHVLPRVGGFVHAVAGCEVGADDSRAGTDVDDVGVGRGHGDRADRAGGFVIEDGRPGGAVVGGAPDAAVVESDVSHVGMAGHTGNRARASGARRPDGAPVHLGIQLGVERLGR